MSTIADLAKRKLLQPPRWLPGAMIYETIMGSMAYGVSSDSSDMDIYGFCIPPKDDVFPHLKGEIPGFGRQIQRFEHFQQHHVMDRDALGGKGREYDFSIYSIVKYFQLAMENNPNMIDSLFTPRSCVLHSTPIAERVREKRRIFLHKGAWHKFKGYSYAQLHKMEIKTPQEGSKRAEDIRKHGFDCYSEGQTEFLTNSGWKRYDEIVDQDLLGVIDIETGIVKFERYIARIDQKYTGRLCTLESFMTRCVVTENHSMLISPYHRNHNTNLSDRFFPEKADWKLIPLSELRKARCSWFYIRSGAELRNEEYDVSDDYLRLAGMFVAEGTIQFRNGKVEATVFTQKVNDKSEFFSVMDPLSCRRYDYAKETMWIVPGEMAERLYADFGHGSLKKELPDWTIKLSYRQAKIFWDHAVLGDGSKATKSDGVVYFTANEQLASGIQAMMVSAGWNCSIRGPYFYEHHAGFGESMPKMWQVYLSAESSMKAVDFKSKSHTTLLKEIDDDKNNEKSRSGFPIKIEEVTDHRVVCFEMPSGTLVTRSGGKAAFQGNCKFAYHIVRLMDEAEQILTSGDLDLTRDAERLKAIRRGDWTAEQVKEFFTRREKELETAYAESKLPHGPNEPEIRALLLECLEAHYGSLAGAVETPGQERALLAQIKELCERAGV